MVKIGQPVPDMEFSVFHEEQIKKVKLSDYKGQWLILLFYPTELEEAASLHPEFKKLKAEIVSVSTDTAFVHKAWHDESPSIKKIHYPMAADPTGALSKAFGVYIDEEGLALRGTFLIDPDGILRTMEIHDLPIGRSGKETLRKLQAAIFVRANGGVEVCPANWSPGQKGLKTGLDMVGKI
jgi:peroxiredoxin (alkyl hydroperoxide reductase subunit C)